MLELLHPAYYSAAPALCPQAFLRLTILTTPVICGPVILPLCSAFFRRLQGLLTGPVCHAGWGWIRGWGWGGGRFRLGWMVRVSGAGEGGSDFGGEVCNELAAMQDYRNTAWFFPPLWGIHLNSCRDAGRGEKRRRGKRCSYTKQMWWIPYFSHCLFNLFVFFTLTYFRLISITFWLLLMFHVKYYGFRVYFTLIH